MLWSVYWHGQQTKTVEGFLPRPCIVLRGANQHVCRPDGRCWFGVGGATLGFIIVCGPRLMVICFGVGPNGTTHDAFCSAVHHVMCCFSTHYGRPSGNGLLGALAARFR